MRHWLVRSRVTPVFAVFIYAVLAAVVLWEGREDGVTFFSGATPVRAIIQVQATVANKPYPYISKKAFFLITNYCE